MPVHDALRPPPSCQPARRMSDDCAPYKVTPTRAQPTLQRRKASEEWSVWSICVYLVCIWEKTWWGEFHSAKVARSNYVVLEITFYIFLSKRSIQHEEPRALLVIVTFLFFLFNCSQLSHETMIALDYMDMKMANCPYPPNLLQF